MSWQISEKRFQMRIGTCNWFSFHRWNRELLSRIEEVAIVHSKNHAETSASLDCISDQLKSVSIHEENGLEDYQSLQENIRSILVQSVYDNAPSTQLRTTIDLPTEACEWICNCQ
ncbi:hypothetical protein GGP41_009494 [Bipolaris sorokiniana]|uniref:Uncharacterized protein n=1 Tax=Cochliobolus sativus TaxID=45130 RepID=A0A8H5ZAI1_COCSA|nr:hypothetical protein GGP41_009494 [Bipolaris sorokiniana]